MFKISNFASIAQVSLRTLRYYDEIGLLKPQFVDPDTAYRFYSIEQLPRLNRILALKELGLDLVQIARLLDEDLPPEHIQGMLRLKQEQLRQRIQEEQASLARIEARLHYLDLNGNMPAFEFLLKSVPAQLVVTKRDVVADLPQRKQFADALLSLLECHSINTTGPLLYIYYDTEYSELDTDVEIAVPIERTAIAAVQDMRENVEVRELAGVETMATVLHYGSPYTIVEAFQALGTWIQANDYTIVGPCRKVRLHWDGALDEYLTEIQFPVERGK